MPAENFSPMNNPNLRGRPRGHGISWYLSRELEKNYRGDISKKQRLAEKIVEIALDEKTSKKDFLSVIEIILDRLEGKAVSTNFFVDVNTNPFENIPTEKIELLQKKLLIIQEGAP